MEIAACVQAPAWCRNDLLLNPLTHRKILKKGVPGRAAIVSRGMFDRDSMAFNLQMTLHVYVEGWQPYEVEDNWLVKSKDAGGLSGSIPVRVDPNDQNRVAIDWDGVRGQVEQMENARRQALAAQGPVTSFGGAQPQGGAQVIDARNNPELRAQLEAALGIELPSSSGAGDPTARLKQLAAMRDAGLISSEDFEAKKADILREL